MLKKIWNNKWFAQIFRTKLGWFIVSFIWTAIWMAVYNNSSHEWPFFVAVPGILYMVSLTLVLIAYAWVINPIREYRKLKELRKKNK